jgi:NAD(P)-dependent dehydrogenase (short-subunit alcohol dehydrogenase family)
MRLANKVIVVTGAGGGIGRSIAARLASEGAHLALFDIGDTADDTAAAIADAARVAGAKVFTACVDVADVDAVRDGVARARDALGPIAGLVNNAGLTANVAPLLKMSDDAWARELAVNLTGPFNLIRAVLPDMIARRWGRIVNISSAAARGGLFRQAGYSASKAGLLGLTRNVTLEFADQGITCNAILPGLIETPAVARMPKVITDYALSLTPARRLGQTDEIAAVVAFLCSDESGYVNGAEIDVDGGGRLCPMVLGSVREVEARRAFGR